MSTLTIGRSQSRLFATPLSRTRGGKLALMTALAFSVSACSGFLPKVGPTKGDIIEPNPEQQIEYAVVQLDAAAVQAARIGAPVAFGSDGFRDARPLRTGLIGRGDVLTVSIWEPVEDGLLTTAGAKQAVIEQVQVDDRGHVFIPYAGSIHAAGKTTDQVRREILAQLTEKTTDPQVTVERVAYRSRGVSLQGAVNAPGVQPLEPATSRLLPMMAAAGGASTPAHSTRVTVRRGGLATSGYLDEIYADPGANIALRNGDIVLVETDERHYNAFGAVLRSGRQAMTERDMSLLDAISSVGGLDGQSANLTGVFVFRREPAQVVSQLTPVDRREAHGMDRELANLEGDVPVVYQLRLDSADGVILADSFDIREGDTIYVTEAPFTQFRKVLSVIIPSVGTAGSVNSLAQ